MRLTIAYSKIKKRNLVLINNGTYQRETLSDRSIRQPLVLTVCATLHINRGEVTVINGRLGQRLIFSWQLLKVTDIFEARRGGKTLKQL